MNVIKTVAPPGEVLPEAVVRNTLHAGLNAKFSQQRVLVLIPDHTRSLPLPMLFKALVAFLEDTVHLDFMVALGTHPPLSEKDLIKLVGFDSVKSTAKFRHIGLLNHNWADLERLKTIGTISREQVVQIAGDLWHHSLGNDVPVRVNKAALEYDQIIILGPTFPHEVVGFSGGAKYIFPGISGPEIIHVSHWLGALNGVINTIGIRETPVRSLIDTAVSMFPKPVTLIALVVEGCDLAGIFIGDLVDAWREAAALSAERHIRWCEQPFQKILSCPPIMYNELWTAAKAMYKLEPVIRKGGEIIIYAPHLEVVSLVHENYIVDTGYHTLPFILENWSMFSHIPLGVVAHLTHLRGPGTIEKGVEFPDFRVTLSSKISADDCARLNLGYLDPDSIDPADFMNREADGVFYVPSAGEILYRLKNPLKSTNW